jgi:hypothetical protein
MGTVTRGTRLSATNSFVQGQNWHIIFRKNSLSCLHHTHTEISVILKYVNTDFDGHGNECVPTAGAANEIVICKEDMYMYYIMYRLSNEVKKEYGCK